MLDFIDGYDTVKTALEAATAAGVYLPDALASQLASSGVGMYGAPGTWAGPGPAQGVGDIPWVSTGIGGALGGLDAWNDTEGNAGAALSQGLVSAGFSAALGPLGFLAAPVISNLFGNDPDVSSIGSQFTLGYNSGDPIMGSGSSVYDGGLVWGAGSSPTEWAGIGEASVGDSLVAMDALRNWDQGILNEMERSGLDSDAINQFKNTMGVVFNGKFGDGYFMPKTGNETNQQWINRMVDERWRYVNDQYHPETAGGSFAPFFDRYAEDIYHFENAPGDLQLKYRPGGDYAGGDQEARMGLMSTILDPVSLMRPDYTGNLSSIVGSEGFLDWTNAFHDYSQDYIKTQGSPTAEIPFWEGLYSTADDYQGAAMTMHDRPENQAIDDYLAQPLDTEFKGLNQSEADYFLSSPHMIDIFYAAQPELAAQIHQQLGV